MMRARYLCLSLMTLLTSSAWAVANDTARWEHLSVWQETNEAVRSNPAIHGVYYRHSYSEMALDIDYQHQTEAFVQEKGTGSFLPQIRVNTFLRLNEQSAVWGSASYMTGKEKDVKWCSTSDYDLLNPYILADTIGGDTHRERYGFSGGYASRLGNWLLGCEAEFRADHEYRDVDPRMRSIVTDLTLRGGVGLEACHYRWGAAVEGNIYKQTNDVEYYRELGVSPEYHMTGLGTDYSRFSGDNNSVYYKGGGIGVSLSANPLDDNGFYGDVNLWRRGYERILADLNSLPISRLVYNAAAITVGWKHAEQHNLALYGNFLFTKRSGDENIVGKSDSQYYPIVGTLTMYKNYLMDASVNVLYGQEDAGRSWFVKGKAGIKSNRERYVYPERRMDRQHLYGSVAGHWAHSFHHGFSLKADMDVSYYGNISADIVMPYANMTASVTEMIDNKYRYAKANYTSFNAKVRGDYALQHSMVGLFAELGGGMVLCSESEQQTGLHLTLGVTF